MSEFLVVLLIVSSVALSIGLSRLAVGEMFRLVSITGRRRKISWRHRSG